MRFIAAADRTSLPSRKPRRKLLRENATKSTVIALATLILTGAADAVERLPSFPKRTSYREVRWSLLGLG